MIESPEYALFKMHQRFRQAQQRNRFRFSRAQSTDPRKELAGYVEYQAWRRLIQMHYQATRTGYNDHWDIDCEGARIEVKGATYSSDRYQAAIRNHDADLLLFGCLTPDDDLNFFVIPGHAYNHTKHITVWTECPADYQGQWAEYYEAWWWVDAIIPRVGDDRRWQPVLL